MGFYVSFKVTRKSDIKKTGTGFSSVLHAESSKSSISFSLKLCKISSKNVKKNKKNCQYKVQFTQLKNGAHFFRIGPFNNESKTGPDVCKMDSFRSSGFLKCYSVETIKKNASPRKKAAKKYNHGSLKARDDHKIQRKLYKGSVL